MEFFHTFNSLYEAGKQIVITSDRPPRELEALEERLRSRFGQGVVVDIGRPDLETRIAILRKQVKWEEYKSPSRKSSSGSPARVTANIRELYGALTRAVSYASIHGSEVTLDLAKEALKDLLPKAYAPPMTIEMVRPRSPASSACTSTTCAATAAPRASPTRDRSPCTSRGPHRGVVSADRRPLRRTSPHHRPLRRQQDRPPPEGRPRPPTPRPGPADQGAAQVRPLTRVTRATPCRRPCSTPPVDNHAKYGGQTDKRSQRDYASPQGRGPGGCVPYSTARPQSLPHPRPP